MVCRLIIGLTILFLTCDAFAIPAQIVIIRHAEKPATGDQVDQQGCERAYSLPHFFKSNPIINEFGVPVAIFASQPDGANSSQRPVETIAPTANALGLEVLDPATRLDFNTIGPLVLNNPSYRGLTVIMSWEHDAIPGLAQALAGPSLALDPDEQVWPDVVFDEAWVLNFPGTGPVTLQVIPENTLPGDNPLGGVNWGLAPGPLGVVPPKILAKCINNNSLVKLTASLVNPPLAPGLSSN